MPNATSSKNLIFGKNVSSYIAGRKQYPKEVIQLIKNVFKLENKITILDLGCGTGIATRQLADKNIKVSGCDADIRMIDAAKRNRSKGIRYYQNAGSNLPFKNSSFDAI